MESTQNKRKLFEEICNFTIPYELSYTKVGFESIGKCPAQLEASSISRGRHTDITFANDNGAVKIRLSALPMKIEL